MAPLPVELAESPDLYDLLCRQQFPGVLSLDPPWGGRRSCMILAVVIAEPTCTFTSTAQESRAVFKVYNIFSTCNFRTLLPRICA